MPSLVLNPHRKILNTSSLFAPATPRMQSRRGTPHGAGLFSAISCPQLAMAGLSDLSRRSSSAVVGYITSLPESDREIVPSHLLPQLHSHPPCPQPSSPSLSIMEPATATSTNTATSAEERMTVILSNQYNCRMHRNRAVWYKGSPLDTAPKCFETWRVSFTHVPTVTVLAHLLLLCSVMTPL